MISLTLANSRQNQILTHGEGPLELGRGPQREVPRIVVEDPFTSRDQLRLEVVSGGVLRVQNLGGPVSLSEGGELASGESRDVTLPVRITFGYSTVDILGQAALPQDRSSLQTIAAPVRRQRQEEESKSLVELGESPTADTLTRWFERLLAVQRAVAGSGEFYGETARAVVELVGLDRGVVLLRANDDWTTAASFPAQVAKPRDVSYRVLAEVVQQRRTFFQTFTEQDWSASLVGVEAVVASPIFGDGEEIVGAVYGTRDLRSASSGRQGIQPLEAQVVQLLAAAVSSGLARVQGEAEAARTRVQFEQFFSPELAKALENDPSLLEG